VSPEPLPGPPDNYALLADFPIVDKERLPQALYRVHQARHDPEWFGIDPRDRWSPPAAAAALFGTCYLATDPVTAIMEAFGDLPVITERIIAERALAVIHLPLHQKLADFTSPAIVGTWKLDRRISTGDDYDTCQRWAHSLRLAGFSGVYYEPRHDPRGPRRHLAGPVRRPWPPTDADDRRLRPGHPP
jgi:hypothetical protein